MLVEISQTVVLAFGLAVCLLTFWGVLAPGKMMKIVYGVLQYGALHMDWGIHLAVVLRLVLGVALVIAAPESRFPLIFEILGWIAIAAAVAILLMGRDRLRKFIGWFQRMSSAMIRVWLLFGIAFGAFLVYGIV
jgi:hypothetical protein